MLQVYSNKSSKINYNSRRTKDVTKEAFTDFCVITIPHKYTLSVHLVYILNLSSYCILVNPYLTES